MPRYFVSVPFAGYYIAEVEADDRNAAADIAKQVPLRLEIKGTDGELVDIGEWEALDSICTGNVLHAPLNEIDVQDDSE